MRLSVLPAFNDPCVVEYESGRRPGPAGTREARTGVYFSELSWRTWRGEADCQRFEAMLQQPRMLRKTFDPTIEVQTVPVDRDDVLKLLRRLSAISICALHVDLDWMGADGCSYELEASGGMCHTHLRWWCDSPAAWRPVMKWFDSTMDWLADRLDVPQGERPPKSVAPR
ncbi:MAG: hypothetical protein R3B68_15295 [Phycisphaerales bacterium]